MITEQALRRDKSGNHLLKLVGSPKPFTVGKIQSGNQFDSTAQVSAAQKQINKSLVIGIKPRREMGVLRITTPTKADVTEKFRQQGKRNTATFGSARGAIWMSDDFDAPLNDFEDY